jgi:hypothetical protein
MTPIEQTPRSAGILSALIGTLVLFAALIAGGTLASAGFEKLHDPRWTGAQSGAALTGFLTGAQFKATKTDKNPYPDVLAPVQELNVRVIAGHTRLVSWLIPLGEIALPLGMLLLLCVRFPGSRYAALGVAALATSLHMVYMLEGSSGENTPLLLMWLTIVWLLATMPAAALHHTVDLGAQRGKRARETPIADTSLGQWTFFAAVALVVGGGGALLHGVPAVVACALGATAIAGTLTLTKQVRRGAALSALYRAQTAR